jgi:hypothetical protein
MHSGKGTAARPTKKPASVVLSMGSTSEPRRLSNAVLCNFVCWLVKSALAELEALPFLSGAPTPEISPSRQMRYWSAVCSISDHALAQGNGSLVPILLKKGLV